jgi:hypothetical protein
MAASTKPPVPARIDLAAHAVAALEDVLADKPVSIMITAEYADRVRVVSVPIESPALMRGLCMTVERMLWPETDEGEES